MWTDRDDDTNGWITSERIRNTDLGINNYHLKHIRQVGLNAFAALTKSKGVDEHAAIVTEALK